MKVNEEKQREILTKIKYEDKSIKWRDTVDGMGFPMLTTTYKSKIYDICVNYDDGSAILYKFNKFGAGECKNMPFDFVTRFVKGEINVMNDMELHFQAKLNG